MERKEMKQSGQGNAQEPSSEGKNTALVGALSEEQSSVQENSVQMLPALQAVFSANGIENNVDALKHVINSYEVLAKAIIDNSMYEEGLRQTVEKTYTQNKVMVELIEIIAP